MIERNTNKVSPFYMRVLIAVCAAIAEQTEKSSEELFSHVSAGRTKSALNHAVHDPFQLYVRAV